MTDDVPTVDALQDLLVALTSGYAGGTEDHWGRLIGKVEKLPIAFHPRSNWQVFPGAAGTPEEREVMTRAIDLVREQHPYVS